MKGVQAMNGWYWVAVNGASASGPVMFELPLP
jgi:hypothetical protein